MSAVPHIRADVRGDSTAACTLIIANAGRSVAYDISAPIVTPVAARSTREPLGLCSEGPYEDVTVAPREGAPSISTIRSASCLVTFGAHHDLFAALGYDTQTCPSTATVTITCGGMALYEAVPTALCSVGM